MAFTLISLLMTSTCLVWLTVMELGYILKNMQLTMVTLLVFSTTTLLGGRWLKVEDSMRKILTLLISIYGEDISFNLAQTGNIYRSDRMMNGLVSFIIINFLTKDENEKK